MHKLEEFGQQNLSTVVAVEINDRKSCVKYMSLSG